MSESLALRPAHSVAALVPADEALRATSYDKLLPPLVAKASSPVMCRRSTGRTGWITGQWTSTTTAARKSFACRAYIFENEWQSFRTRQQRDLDLTSAPHTYTSPGRYTIAVKVIDIFGNDTMTLVRVTVG